ncbi:MSC_0622 family F1-like ATPase gamma subunit [Metamycoplasma neophronis]|uniref:ATP synthase gamma chain n=1 Tax=Metamycoplasma neophronis TaxID=872983 RepID=A0ABY2Z582_9BACT|nr:hypothetical protein [Metamycoplasma neophronis]TPR54063.1 hypothetical protein FJR74_01310 [Metamycoplasma neophronis]
MQIKTIKEKNKSLDNILKIIESKKNITLINILKLTKRIAFYYERTERSRNIIKKLSERHQIDLPILNHEKTHWYEKSKWLRKLSQKLLPASIWVYITEEEKYDTNSYLKHELNIEKNYRKNDVFIAIGKRAINFCKNKNYNVIYSEQENDIDKLTKVLPDFILNYLKAYGFFNVRFIINSSKLKQDYLEILPMKKLNFDLQGHYETLENEIDLNKLTIYPDIISFINSEINSYLTYMTLTLLSESSLIYQKYKLVDENQKINDLEKKQRQLHLKELRAKREIEVEQISLLSKKKDLLYEKSKNEKN